MIREASVLSCLPLMSGSFAGSGREGELYCTGDIQGKIVQAGGDSVLCKFCDAVECMIVYLMVLNHMVSALEISLIDYSVCMSGKVPDVQDYQSLLTHPAIFNCLYKEASRLEINLEPMLYI